MYNVEFYTAKVGEHRLWEIFPVTNLNKTTLYTSWLLSSSEVVRRNIHKSFNNC